ncbi:MAG: SRPBCC domain-containing protein [Terriglobales bacterium]|jgi:hypothetical protein
MPDITHSIAINAKILRVFKLISSADGLSRWWAEDVTVISRAPFLGLAFDDVVGLGFFNRATIYRLRLVRSIPRRDAKPHELEWACESGKEWSGTRLIFRLADDGPRTRVRFTHADWQAATDYFVDCNTTWGALMFRL